MIRNSFQRQDRRRSISLRPVLDQLRKQILDQQRRRASQRRRRHSSPL